MVVKSARLSAVDALNFCASQPGAGTDWFLAWVFVGDGTPVDPAAIQDHFRSRRTVLDELFRTVAEVPGALDYPYWLRDPSTIDTHLSMHREIEDWANVQTSIGSLAENPLDATASTWHAHVYPAVSGVPGTDTESTLVVMQMSHAVIAGPSTGPLTHSLFGPSPQPLRIPGLDGLAQRRHALSSAAVGLARIPSGLLRRRRLLRKAVQQNSTPQLDVSDGTAPALSARPDTDRVVRSLRLNLTALQDKPETVTTLATTALSLAVQRYLDAHGEDCPPTLSALLTVAVADNADALGVNRILAATAGLFPDISDMHDRAAAIGADSRRARAHATGPATLPFVVANAAAPFLLARFGLRTATKQFAANPTLLAPANLVLTSVNAGPSSGCELAGRTLDGVGVVAALPPTGGILHSVVGCGDRLTVSFVTSRRVIPDIDDYAAILDTAFADVAAQFA